MVTYELFPVSLGQIYEQLKYNGAYSSFASKFGVDKKLNKSMERADFYL